MFRLTRALLGAALLVAGCVRGPGLPADAPPTARIVDASTAVPASWSSLIADLLRARVVYVGESHDEPAHHEVQAAIVRALHQRDPSLSIGLEMIQRPFQPALDAWVAGAIDEATLLERVEWEDRWGFDFGLYRPIFRYVREHDIPMVALNARAETTRAAAHGGLEGLQPSVRAELPTLDLDEPSHRALVLEPLRAHGDLSDEAVERFYLAQVIWDETMARQVARYLAAPDAPRRMVVLAGGMHVRRPAIPARAARRGARPHRIVLPVADKEVRPVLQRQPPLVDWLWAL